MLKELENKVAIIMNERPEPEINVVTFNLENYGDVLVQDYLPTEDLDRMYDMCINDLRKGDSSSSVVERNLLREYTNIDVDSLTPKELSKVYDDIYYNMWNDGASMVWDLYERVGDYYEDARMKRLFGEVLNEYFTDQVTRNAFEQVQHDLEEIDMDVVGELLKLFGATNKIDTK